MAVWKELFRCIGLAFREKGLAELAPERPLTEALPELALITWQNLQESGTDGLQWIEPLAQATPAEVKRVAREVAEEVAANQPPEARAKIAHYLEQIPGTLRQSLRRPADPSGSTLASAFVLVKPEDYLQLLPARLPHFQAGDRPAGIGDWELVELLGIGGFGEVWKARHIHFDGIAPVALKFCLDPVARTRLLQYEAKVLNQVMKAGRHPGIVSLLDASLSAEPPCLRYELIEGGDLASVIREGWDGPRWERATRLISDLAAIVGYAHRLSPAIVHRDLKPANVLVQAVGDAWTLKVTDFGIGAVAALPMLSQSRQGTVSRGEMLATALRGACTPLYASPQQMRGEPADPRDDVHALGVIWYQLLIGDLSSGPPTGMWTDELEEQGVPRALVRLLGSCVAARAEKRPTDAMDLVAKLNAALVDREAILVTHDSKALTPPARLEEPASPVTAILKNLETNAYSWMLDLTNRQLGDAGVIALAAAPQLSRVSVLILSGNQVTDAGLIALANSPHVENLSRLVLWDNRIGDAGVEALAACPRLVNLTTLDIGSNRVGDVGIQALAASPHLVNLTALILVSNQISDIGARALVQSKTLTNLAELKLLLNRITAPGVIALQRRFGKRVRIY
jgi:serine/threonine protein kinase